MKLSVVVPTLNEKATLGELLDHLDASTGVAEIVVADGGSTDGTVDIAESRATVVRTGPGRGIQLRAGAAATTGDVLLFLHADVTPPQDAVAQIGVAIDAGYVGGNFRLRYPGGGLLGRWLEFLAPIYRKIPRYYGDSGLFVRRDAYEAFGGFPHIPVMEDVVFVRRMERYGETAYLPGPMVSAARRWQKRPLRTMLLWGFMQIAYALGVSPWRLARFYRRGKG